MEPNLEYNLSFVFSPQKQTNESRLLGWCWLTQWWRVHTLDSCRLSGGCERLLSESSAIILTLATPCYTSVRGKPTEILLEPTKKYFGIQLRNTFGNNIDHDQGLCDTLLAHYWHIGHILKLAICFCSQSQRSCETICCLFVTFKYWQHNMHLWNLAGCQWCLIAMQTTWFDLKPTEFRVVSREPTFSLTQWP